MTVVLRRASGKRQAAVSAQPDPMGPFAKRVIMLGALQGP
jgi:hypothetical protein